jgi:hypothetical protein
MPPLYPAATIAAAAHGDIEAAHHGPPYYLFLILRFVALKLDPTSATGTLFRQPNADRFIDPRRCWATGVLAVVTAWFAARALRVVLGFAPGMRCRLTVRGPQGCFPLFAEALDFLLEPVNLPLLSFDLLPGPVQLLGANKVNRIWLPSALPQVPRGSHPLYGNRSEGFCSALFARGRFHWVPTR